MLYSLYEITSHISLGFYFDYVYFQLENISKYRNLIETLRLTQNNQFFVFPFKSTFVNLVFIKSPYTSSNNDSALLSFCSDIAFKWKEQGLTKLGNTTKMVDSKCSKSCSCCKLLRTRVWAPAKADDIWTKPTYYQKMHHKKQKLKKNVV